MSELTMNQIVEALELMSDENDPASIRVNDDGRIFLEIGLSYSERLTQSEFYDLCMKKLQDVNGVRQHTRKLATKRVMVFRHDNSDLDFRLEPLNVPGSVTMDNVTSFLMTLEKYPGEAYTVVEVGCEATYNVKQKPPHPQVPEYYVEVVSSPTEYDPRINRC